MFRLGLATLIPAVVLAASCAATAAPPPCAVIPAAGTDTADGWVGWLAEHRRDVALVLEDGRGGELAHRESVPAPSASASKVIHLAAHARGVSEGRIDPEEMLRIADWEAWYAAGTDAGAHPSALEHLGIPHDGLRALDPERTVRLADVVTAMIRFSDNAAADLLRDRLGDRALLDAAAAGGWRDADLPSFLGQVVALLEPELAAPPGAPREERAAAELTLARRYAADPAFAAQVGDRPAPGPERLLAWADGTGTATANGLTALHRSIATGSFGAGAELARRELERSAPPDDAIGLGFKGGSLPGVLAEALTLRRKDGTTASAVLLVRRMPVDAWLTATQSLAHQEMLLAALDDPEGVRCTLAAPRHHHPGER